MLEYIILILFILILFASVIFNQSMIIALLINLILLIIYALIKKYKPREILNMIYIGLKDTKTILIIFCLIGMITGIWRLSGTISYMIYYGTSFISPKFFYVGVFIFNSIISFLTGTSFGTASTAGIICMSISNAMNFNPFVTGGAILSGAFFGDRSSPMSTSALLVATITETNIYTNLKNMFKTCVIPLILTIITFQIFNLGIDVNLNTKSISAIAEIFNFNILLIIPTVSIIILSILKLDLKINMIISILISIIFAKVFQSSSYGEIFKALIFGYHIDSAAGELINGGGLISMINMHLIVGISSGYFGFFKYTDLLKDIKEKISKIFAKSPKLLVMSIISVIISVFSSNQTLTIMLSYEMARESYKNREELALDMENSAVMTPIYIPWNIAGRTPIEMVGAPVCALYFSFYHHYIILVNTIFSIIEFMKNKSLSEK